MSFSVADPANVVALPHRKPNKIALTQRRVDNASARAERYEVRDPSLPGFMLRVSATSKTYAVSTRVGRGRGTKRVRVTIGDARVIKLHDARERARQIITDAKAGIDPTTAANEQSVREQLLDYQARLARDGVVKAADMIATLKRGLKGDLLPKELARAMIVAEIERLEYSGRPGAADYFRKTVVTFLNWLVDRGAIAASPMAGYRRPRETRAQRLSRRPWVMCASEEIRQFWTASEAASNPVHRDLLRFILLTGQRRTETSLIEHGHIADSCWHPPAENTKTGTPHNVPLGPLSLALIDAQPQYAGTGLIFPGRGMKPISGWSKLIAPIRRAFGDDRVSCHGLRRTFRTGLSSLGVEEAVAELMIAHRRSDLIGRYDHSDLWSKRAAAQNAWEDHVASAIE
ncbi:MAG: integrase arm-type DNA-binding domain-containing protein [Paracoccaceae bacterium]|nr:integrase arm-type DNA-binding domain-containing protein [Paracoccaceae bacterium]